MTQTTRGGQGESSDRSAEGAGEGKFFMPLSHELELGENACSRFLMTSPFSGGSPASLACRDKDQEEKLENRGELTPNE